MKSLSWCLVAMLALAGCAKDKTAEEYQREKNRQTKSQYDAVSGDYSGVVYSKETGEVMGAMSLTLATDEIKTPPKDGEPTLGSPILAGSLTFLNSSKVTLSAPVGIYDPSTGNYRADLEASPTERITLTGTIVGNAFVGSVQAQKFPGAGGRFRLQTNMGSVESLLEQARPGGRPAPNNGAKTFNGTGKLGQEPRSMQIEVTRSQSRNEDFLDLFFPNNERRLQLTVRFTESVGAHFPSAVWDPISGRVEGEFQGNGYTARLVCQNFYFRATRGAFFCVYSTSRSSPIRIDFKPPFN